MAYARILIIEDEPLQAEQLRLCLLQAGYRISAMVDSGEAAVEYARTDRVDLIVADIMLSSEVDGIEAVRRIHKFADIPTIFLTAYTNDELLLRAEQVRPFAYLLKPYQPTELEFMVRVALTRAKLEQELAREKELALADLRRAQSIIEHTNEGIMLTDTESVIVSVNPAFTRITGYSAAEVIGSKTSMLSSGRHGKSFYESLWATIRRSGYWQGEIWNRRKNGEIYPEWLTISPIFDNGGSLTHYVGMFTDFSSVKQTENALRESRSALARAQRIAHLGNWSYRVADGHTEWSEELYRIFGREPQSVQITYDLLRSWIHPDDQKQHDTYHERLLTLKPGWNIAPLEYRLLQPNGQQRWVQVDSAVDFGEDGRALRLVGTVLDITERKKSESEHNRLSRELQQAHKMDAIGQLTGGIAHDFNNQLGIILGFINLARSTGINPEKQGRYLDQAKKAGERATKLVSQMLSFSRADQGESKPLQLYPLVKEDLALLGSTLPSTIRLKLEMDESLPEVMMDPTQFHQILMNLCINARDAMDGNGEIHITLTKTVIPGSECAACFKWVEGEWVELAVTDNGGGIEKRLLPRIFEPFFTTKESGKGTGMGLAVIGSILKHHSSHVLVDTREGLGTTFRLLFPPLKRTAASSPLSDTGAKALAQGHGEEILVVDDEPDLGQFLGDLLELYGYRPSIFADSRKALDEFLKNPTRYSLLLTDQTMPLLSGLELIDLVRGRAPDLPVIICTGYSEKIDSESAARQGIRYLDKPIDTERLITLLADIFPSPGRYNA
ncbi:MAG: response regulator [Gammaproteobacteria bacterium]|nr:response regulator [Gammaproteobacteria bacterium]